MNAGISKLYTESSVQNTKLEYCACTFSQTENRFYEAIMKLLKIKELKKNLKSRSCS
jgi:hypothetical protein